VTGIAPFVSYAHAREGMEGGAVQGGSLSVPDSGCEPLSRFRVPRGDRDHRSRSSVADLHSDSQPSAGGSRLAWRDRSGGRRPSEVCRFVVARRPPHDRVLVRPPRDARARKGDSPAPRLGEGRTEG
jgi:hypothetical protein